MFQERSLSSDRDFVEFCAFLRGEAFNTGVKETLDALTSRRLFAGENREAVRVATRAVLSSSKEEWDRFDGLFAEFWGSDVPSCNPDKSRDPSKRTPSAKDQEGHHGDNRDGIAIGIASESSETEEGRSVSGASAAERLRKSDFAKLPPSEIGELERIAQRLLNQMSFRLSRRMKIACEGRLDLRRTIRQSVGRGGDPFDLLYRGKKRRRPKLVIMIDVSGSMQLYSRFMLMFAYALQKYFRQVQSFVFSTSSVEITDSLNSNSFQGALTALSEVTAGWSGGTRIGETLQELNLNGTGRVFSRDTLLIMCSDGLDTGEPDLLEQELAAVKRRAGKIIWLTPLLGMDNYQPITRGISAALPLIDVFAPCHNLDSLLKLERLL